MISFEPSGTVRAFLEEIAAKSNVSLEVAAEIGLSSAASALRAVSTSPGDLVVAGLLLRREAFEELSISAQLAGVPLIVLLGTAAVVGAPAAIQACAKVASDAAEAAAALGVN